MSIKGIYYQAEIMGQTVTWIVPHSRGFQVTNKSYTQNVIDNSMIELNTVWLYRKLSARLESLSIISKQCLHLIMSMRI